MSWETFSLLVYGAGLVVGAIYLAVRWIRSTEDRAALFVRYHAAAPTRTADCIVGFGAHLSGLFDEPRGSIAYNRHRDRAFAALGLTVLLVLGPYLLAVEATQDRLAAHPIALAVGTLTWATAVELGGWPGRLRRYRDEAPTSDHALAEFSSLVVLLLLDVAIVIAGAFGLAGNTAFAIGLTGAAVVALADIVAFTQTAAIAQGRGAPLL